MDFVFWRKTDEMMKTGRRDQNIDFDEIGKVRDFWQNFFDEICTL